MKRIFQSKKTILLFRFLGVIGFVLGLQYDGYAQCPTTTYPICSGESYTLAAPTSLTAVKWYKNGVLIPSATSSSYTANAVGDYQWAGTNATTLCRDSLCCPVKIVAGTCGGGVTTYPICAGESYTLAAPAGITNIKWYKDGVLIPSATGSSYIANAVGDYRWAGTNATTSCRDSLCVAVKIVVGTCALGSIGDFVWKDANNDGIQNETTANAGGVKDVIIELYKNGTLFAKDTTDATGKYLFSNLAAGTYKIKILVPSLPAGCSISTKQNVATGGGTDNNDSDIDSATGFSGDYIIDPAGSPSTKDVTNADAGLYTAVTPCNLPDCLRGTVIEK
jgi:SdrD B-like domain